MNLGVAPPPPPEPEAAEAVPKGKVGVRKMKKEMQKLREIGADESAAVTEGAEEPPDEPAEPPEDES